MKLIDQYMAIFFFHPLQIIFIHYKSRIATCSVTSWVWDFFFFLQSKIAYVVLLSIFRLRDGYMSWRQ